MKQVLTIAGSDSGGGAGIQADLKTMLVHGVYGLSVITALTAQNTMGIDEINVVSPSFVKKQLDCIFADFHISAIKIGMIPNYSIGQTIIEVLKIHKIEAVVVDPVMQSTSQTMLSEQQGCLKLYEELLPFATLVTPNISEGEVLWGKPIHTDKDMEEAAKTIRSKYSCDVLLKGGHKMGEADDVLATNKGIYWLRGKRISCRNNHGTGCTLSSSIASNLAKGDDLMTSVTKAKAYISGALIYDFSIGQGNGPLHHGYSIFN